MVFATHQEDLMTGSPDELNALAPVEPIRSSARTLRTPQSAPRTSAFDPGTVAAPPGADQDVVSALVNLGYKASLAERAESSTGNSAA